MKRPKVQGIIDVAIDKTTEMNPQKTDGKWLEVVTVESGPYIKEWDIEKCWAWENWPEREIHFPKTTRQDVGIDAVAMRRSDQKYIAVQCKSRQLNKEGRGDSLKSDEIAKFASASASEFWAERWIVTNGDNPLASGARQALSMHTAPLKLVNITNDLHQQLEASTVSGEDINSRLDPEYGELLQTKSSMQDEAVSTSVRILKEMEHSTSGGLPEGEARGKIILPCGTGKTRISLRIIEELTPSGKISIVLCPSIALVGQIRREYLQNARGLIDVLAVCSDATAGFDPKKEGVRNATLDPTIDSSNFSASEVKGKVTTDVSEIAKWIRKDSVGKGIKVLIGTYQSSIRVSDALLKTEIKACVLIADEAHRTAGLKRRNSKSVATTAEEQRLRDFTVCHDNARFPVTYRVYQTATPRIYDGKKPTGNTNWIVRSMDDETTFGVELYRKSYLEAVRNKWLSDYRIIAMGINDLGAFTTANNLAKATKSTGRRKLTTADYLRGLAFSLTMGGATQGEEVDIKSCIAFMNTVDKSRNMATDLQADNVKKWVSQWLNENAVGRTATDYSLEHLDASSSAAARETAKARLAAADAEHPHGIINVGIFGEGTDSPSLSAVAFLEARKSPIDVVQAVGRAMRTAPGKDVGYIICPILIPPTADPEKWLSNSDADEGWQELGQILLALRAHDQRIEESLEDLLQLYIPKPPAVECSMVAIAKGEGGSIQYGLVVGPSGTAQKAVEEVLAGKSQVEVGIQHLDVKLTYNEEPDPYTRGIRQQSVDSEEDIIGVELEITQIFTGKKNRDGTVELRTDSVARNKPNADEIRGVVNIQKTQAKARKMINNGEGGIRVQKKEKPKNQPTTKDLQEEQGQLILKLSGLEDHGSAIKMNLLSKSGLSENRVMRDLNILESSITEAAHHMRADGLLPTLNRHFGLDQLKSSTEKQADGCTIAALLMMNAAMLHQRISNGGWLSGISDLSLMKNEAGVVRKISREWERIMRHDFRPVLEPALETIYAVEVTGKAAGLERTLHHLAAEAARIAETYADIGADHAGPLFNRVMGNQASDGAFFSRPVAASLAARLTLDACGDLDWSDSKVWKRHKTVDLACGSGTLLAAMLTDMKRRATDKGADTEKLNQLQKLAVEDVIKGLDINPVSLQLAASQLTAGNQRVSYRRMGLHLMAYGPDKEAPDRVNVGTLELLAQRVIVQRPTELEFDDDVINSQVTWNSNDNSELEDAVDAVKNARIVIMNPPFTNRAKMGEKFPKEIQKALRIRADGMEQKLTQADPGLERFADKNSVGPLFVGLAEHCIDQADGVLTMINPTIALTTTSGQRERLLLAQRFHIHTILTSHQPRNINLSQHTAINESIVVMKRLSGKKPRTRFINLDRMPKDEGEVEDFYSSLHCCEEGMLANGWGEVSYWPAEKIEAGDWTPAIWRSPVLAKAAADYSNNSDLGSLRDVTGQSPQATGQVLRGAFEKSDSGVPGSFPILKSKSGVIGQTTIHSNPDEYWILKKRDEQTRLSNGGSYPEADRILEKAGYLLITAGQDNASARLVAVAADNEYVGNGWMPVAGVSPKEAKAVAVFLNSTVGRLQMMRNAGRKLEFPTYSAAETSEVRIPNIKDERICATLTECWNSTKEMEVPPYRDGECIVRHLWDQAVAEAMRWDAVELMRLRLLLHQEPHVSGLGFGQYADYIQADAIDRERFTKLADKWESETWFISNPDSVAAHPAHIEIIDMGDTVVPLILERVRENLEGKRKTGGNWYSALRNITGANPIKPNDRGNQSAMQKAWLDWGVRNGYS
ncbi:MAG: DEAD/DEAH box helicase family protein [Gammaproteobacteria bacterium]|nr:DEAD/DEAH box helicase family protein [Gammaproteobacteria bacterium]